MVENVLGLTSEHPTFCGECTWPDKGTSNIRLRMYLAWQVNTYHLVEYERDMTSEHLTFGGELTWSDKWTTNIWWRMYLFQLHYGKYYWPAESHWWALSNLLKPERLQYTFFKYISVAICWNRFIWVRHICIRNNIYACCF